jgi:hypothetical protein
MCNPQSSIVVANPIVLAAKGVSIAQPGYTQTMITIHQEVNNILRLFKPLRHPTHLVVRFPSKSSESGV